MHTYIRMYVCTYIHTYVRTYIHTYIHTYIFVVNFDALAQASDFRIERRQVVFLCWMQDSNPRPHDAAYCLLTHHLQVHEIIFPPYLAYIRRNCLGMDVNNLESILVQVMTCHRQTAYSNKLKQTEQDILNPTAEILVIWLFYYPPPMHRSINWVSIDSGNGFPPVWRQAITWSSADLIKTLCFVPVRTPPPAAAPAPAAYSCSRDNFCTSTTFWISFIFGIIVDPER